MQDKQFSENRPLRLWWYDFETKKNLSAGVAFHEVKYGEYRLKIDIHPHTTYFLRPISAHEKNVQYRVEVLIPRGNGMAHRRSVGEGLSSPSTNGDVYIELGPYSKILIMEMNIN